jgi:hypothetical protein
VKDSQIFFREEKILAEAAKNMSEEPRTSNCSRKIHLAKISEAKIHIRKDEESAKKEKEFQSLDFA